MTQITASNIMTRDVRTVGPDWPVARLLEFLTHHCISGAPVVADDGAPIGVVSLTDVARSGALTERSVARTSAYYLPGLEMVMEDEEILAFRINESRTTVGDIMTSVVFSVDDEAPIQDVANEMITGHIHRVLVTRAGKMVGIISSMDLLPLVRSM
jgi:predicted transcriptional regulator